MVHERTALLFQDARLFHTVTSLSLAVQPGIDISGWNARVWVVAKQVPSESDDTRKMHTDKGTKVAPLQRITTTFIYKT